MPQAVWCAGRRPRFWPGSFSQQCSEALPMHRKAPLVPWRVMKAVASWCQQNVGRSVHHPATWSMKSVLERPSERLDGLVEVIMEDDVCLEGRDQIPFCRKILSGVGLAEKIQKKHMNVHTWLDQTWTTRCLLSPPPRRFDTRRFMFMRSPGVVGC